MQKSAEEYLNGQLLLIDKPLDWTSFDVVNKIRWKLRRELGLSKIKVGHAGTLDPKATGLLLVCTGKMTKSIQELQGLNKTYTGVFKIGVETPSYDSETEEIHSKDFSFVTQELLEQTKEKFIGKIQQFPPLHSAIKKDGKKLYQLARSGKSAEVEPRWVEIFSFNFQKVEIPFIHFEIECSKGTYIRSIAHDFGKALGCGAYLYALRRTKIGNFSVENALQIQPELLL